MSLGTVVVPMTAAESAFAVGMSVDAAIEAVEAPAYAGPYTVTPAQETQTLATARRYMTGNVVVNPIPSNYGKITWNGAYLTVS